MTDTRRQWIELCARSILKQHAWLGTVTAIKIAADLWTETRGALDPQQAGAAELARWASAYVVAIEGRHPEFRDSASAALSCAMQMLAIEHESLTAQVRTPAGDRLVALRREDDGSITDLTH